MELLWRAPRRNTLITWPQAVDDRLERLLAAGLAAQENMSRSQLLAALVVNAEVSPEHVAALVRAYRSMSADALDDTPSSGAVQDWPTVRHPGPRRKVGRRKPHSDVQKARGNRDIGDSRELGSRDVSD
ncbi:hypothetical protein ACFFMN_12150 [Planobispora siamensis]|uniref:Uncharacterized protein n=1 Tax=Planobispora siamensis TaxID=936338 RepID=A0A8J3WJI8_9ACTN|nr:hypothetical protein [Planobispora siamensis]GIH89896.1 hypothetical protein Psi01_05260 [Planobispora siamensis]